MILQESQMLRLFVVVFCCCFFSLCGVLAFFFFFNRGNSTVRPLGPNSPYLEEGLCVF